MWFFGGRRVGRVLHEGTKDDQKGGCSLFGYIAKYFICSFTKKYDESNGIGFKDNWTWEPEQVGDDFGSQYQSDLRNLKRKRLVNPKPAND